MKLHLQIAGDTNLFTAYDSDYVAVNGVRHERSLIVLPEQVITEWQPVAPDAMTAEHFSALAELELEILLLGTGPRLHFPSPRLIHALAQKGIGLEAMDTFAACRTYNILAAEGRKVAAALLLEFKE
ncbi:MAG: Mth938-like domain-containing protein [Gammaproteobacteria bacterium]|nr:Mth938-like domain-containing protein [Gammaproteobacteria bacterium]MBU1732656.1 Mth938-like domain-containing protein [Gammaproteobacteria bacterium]MBU1891930.1 Mth938-like domain-containing protein [Gammaproteobacteria bacterium]